MRKTYKCSLLALSVLASFTSCSESESLQQANLSDDKITFQPSLDNSWKPLSPSSSSRAAKDAANEEGPIVVPTSYGKPLYLHSLGQNGIYIWSKDGKRITRSGAPLEDGEQERAVQTRGAQKKNIGDYGSFGVTAIYKEGNTNVSLFQKDGNPEIAVATPSNNFWGIQDSRWPMQGEVSFHAFAPYNANVNSPLEYTQDIANGKTQIKYTASNTDVASQPDLIVATNKGSKSKEALGLNFYHALTAVTFAVDKTVAEVLGKGKQLMKVELRGIRNKGICNLSLSGTANVPSAQWTLEDDRVTYSFDFTDQNIILGQQDYALTLGDKTLMMIPQRLDNAAEVCFTVKDNVETKEYTMSLSGKTWVAGTSVIYKLSSHQVNGFGLGVINYDNSWNKFDNWAYIQDNGGYYTNYPKSTFQQYDEVGLYIVNKSNELVAENIFLIRQDIEWRRFEDNLKFPYSRDNCRYFFYYPYKKDKQKVNVNAETAEEFFKDKIDNLDITVDQSNWSKSKMADLQVGKLEILPSGYSNVTMKHQVGLVVLHMPSSQYGTIRFKNDSWKYYYGEKRARPKEIADYDILGGVGGNADAHYYPSRKFVGNYPYINQRVDYSSNQGWYRCAFIVPFGKTVKFKAEDNAEEYRSSNYWGYLQDISASTSRDNPIVKINIECDVPGVKIAREYYGNAAKVEQFDIPEATDYEFECWGSKGQSKNGGIVPSAGYAGGSWTASENNKQLFICCGNQSGFNNGRSKALNCDAGVWGGGGTHIATSKLGTGETYEYVNNRDQLLIVAGGSGGSGASGKQSGAGGGESGLIGTGSFVASTKPKGGTQNAPGTNASWSNAVATPAQFGIGGYLNTHNIGWGAQGGGGYFGGGGTTANYSGAGGSSYKSNPQLKNGMTLDGASLDQSYKNSSYYHPYSYESAVLGLCRITWTYHRPATLK
mgnify:FL=1